MSTFDIITAGPAFFPLALELYRFCLSFTNLFVSWYLKWVYWVSQHIIGSCFFMQSDNFCCLTGVFKPSIFVIVDKVMLKSTLVSCFWFLPFVLCSPFSSFSAFFWIILCDSILSPLLTYQLYVIHCFAILVAALGFVASIFNWS